METKMEITYIDRIKQLKSQKKITNDMLSDMTGIPLGTLSKILAGISDSPKLANIVSICGALGCSLDYILTGIPENTNNYTLDDDEIEFIENYRKLDSHGRELVSLVAEKEAERAGVAVDMGGERSAVKVIRGGASMRGEAMRSVTAFQRKPIELYDLPVSAGTGMYITDMESTTITIPVTQQSASASYALRIKGNSMEPKYRDGDILLVEETDTLEYGELGIFILDGDGYFKKYEGDRLISLNPEYAPIMLDDFDSIVFCGRVTGKLKRK